MATYYKDGVEATEQEIRALNPNTAFGYPFNPSGLGWEVVFDTPQPTITELQVAYQDGTEIDAKGNRVIKWAVRDMFADTVDKTKLQQETEYLAAKTKALVPKALTPRQIRLVLNQYGLRANVETAVANSTDYNIKDWWEYSLEYLRDNTILVGMATTLGLTDTQLDQMFIDGAKL